MADKYINSVGVGIIRDWANGKFALDADLDALDARVDEIVAEGGEPNVIETVKVNGIALTPDTQKAVDVTVPTKVSDLTNDGDGTTGSRFATETYVDENGGKIDVIKVNGTTQTITNKEVNLTVPTFERNTGVGGIGSVLIKEGSSDIIEFASLVDGDTGITDAYALNVYSANGPNQYFDIDLASIDYVDANGGKIDVIKVNGTAQTITNKEVDLIVPTKVSDITNDANYQNDTQVDAKIASAVASAVTLKGSVATYSALPSTGQKHGDMYDVLDTGKNYVWIVEEGTGRWDDYAGTMDMSAYWTSTTGQTNTLEAMTVAEVNAILEPSA